MNKENGFTLIELLVLVVSVGLLCAVLFVHVRPARHAARRCSCMSNTRQIGLAMIQYAGDYNDSFMALVSAEGKTLRVIYTEDGVLKTDRSALRATARSGFAHLLKEGYLTTTKVFVCPSSNETLTDDTFPSDYRSARLQDLILPERNCSYGWDPTKRHSADATCAILADKPSDDVSAARAGTAKNNSDNHNKEGQNVFYNDGHTKWMTTSKPDAGDDPDFYLGDAGYETSNTDAKIIR